MTFWRAALAMIKDSPFFGQGIGSFFWRLPAYSHHAFYENAHNYFLQTGAELGMVGLIAFLWLLVIILKSGVSLFLQLKDRYWKLVVGGLISGILGFLLTCLTDHPLVLLEMQFVFWSVTAILFALHEHLRA